MKKQSQKHQKTDTKMAEVGLTINTILNVNGQNFPIKGHIVAEWLKKKNKTNNMLCSTRNTLHL